MTVSSKKSSEACCVPPALPALEALTLRVLPGTSAAITRLRQQVIDVCLDPTANHIAVTGPIGVGKSTIARLIGFGKATAPLNREAVQGRVDLVRVDSPGRIDALLMSWYVELVLTGLVENLAESQLFGTVEGAATDVAARPGVFKQAMTGLAGPGDEGVAVTGGVVFLDEIGDLPQSLQAKLLPVLSGEQTYPVGAEGDRKQVVEFDGVIIVATWRAMSSPCIRPDLQSRLSQHIIEVPGLEQRREDLADIIAGIHRDLVDRRRGRIKRLLAHGGQEIAKEYWQHELRRERLLDAGIVDALAGIDWARRGQLRGLTHVVDHVCIGGRSIEDVVDALQVGEHGEHGTESLLSQVLTVAADDMSFTSCVREVEARQRESLVDYLREHPQERMAVETTLGISGTKMGQQMRDLARRRDAK